MNHTVVRAFGSHAMRGLARRQPMLGRTVQQQQQTMIRSNMQQSRSFAAKASPVYNAILNTNAKYVLFIIAGATVGEIMFNGVLEGIWNLKNKGKLYKDIDWSKWESIYQDEEEEEEDEE